MSRRRMVAAVLAVAFALAALAGRADPASAAKGKPDQKQEIVALDA